MSSPKIWTRRIAALALGLGLAMSAVIVPCWWSIARYHNPSCSAYKPDFISLYTGAKLLWNDRSALYDLEKQRLVQEPIDPSRGSWVLPFFYPPFVAVFLLPLAWLPFSASFVAMTAVNLALLTVAITMLIRTLQLNREQTKWLLLSTF
ncbi:MAG TPA: glycosyltransferase family 87 protein, partial [Candidatus Binatia bacterium]|nr:glycosyltransferase family 87 protein [Candidatus Binatia bacterium]